MKKFVACAAALAGFALSAHAADLGDGGSLKDPLPDTLSYHGVTVYGTVDVGYAYQTNGRPLGNEVSDLEYSPFTTTRNYTGQSISTLQANALEQSKIGVKIEENIGYGFEAIGRLEAGFNPVTGELSDGCSSFFQNAGVPFSRQTSNADSGRCGQAFNSVAYGGVSSPAYGTLTAGRQDSLMLEAMRDYDPMSLSYAFSLMGYSGTWSGSGSTQAARWDNSVKYFYQYGPLHAGAMYSNGGEDTGTLGTAYGFVVGGSYRGFSIDGVYTKENNAVNLIGSENDPTAIPNALFATVTDDEAWSVMGKYVYDFGGGYKDEGPRSKLTFFTGYEHIDQSNGSLSIGSTAFTNGGYEIVNTPGKAAPYYTTPKELEMEWAGARYEFGLGWSITGAYYHVDQGAFVKYGKSCATAEAGSGNATASKGCAGDYDQGSILLDYAFNKHFDVYGGVTYAIVRGGLASGYAGTANPDEGATGSKTSIDTAAVVTGLRLKF
ncbi:MAG: porin [Rhodomicrobium sp.]|jgi:predicted porin